MLWDLPWRPEILTAEHGAKDLGGMFGLLSPGTQVSYYYHNKRESVITVISGSGIEIMDGEKIPINAGDVFFIPAGSLMTMGIHHADVFNYLFGPIKSVFSYFNKLYIPAPVEDVTATVFQYETGVLGYLGSNYVSPKAVWFYVYSTEANLLCTITPLELPFEEYLLWWQQVDQDNRQYNIYNPHESIPQIEEG
jgi:quercetin dioxygenase-like cupin family protein